MSIRNICQIVQHIIPTSPLIRAASRNIFSPFYHAICDVQMPHIQHLYPVKNISSFNSALDFFCKNYQPVSIYELNDIVCGKVKHNKPVFHLTFDDGLKEIYTIVAPILKKRKIPATFFLNTKFIDNKALFFRYKVSLIIDRVEKEIGFDNSFKVLSDVSNQRVDKDDYFKKLMLNFKYSDEERINFIADKLGISFDDFLYSQEPYLTSKQITEVLEQGFTIGSHSVDHPLFLEIDFESQKEQILDSFNYLSQNWKIDNKFFSFPFSDVGLSLQFFNWLKEDAQVDLSFGTSGLKDDCYSSHLHRTSMDGKNVSAKTITKTEYLYYIIKSFVNRNKVYRK